MVSEGIFLLFNKALANERITPTKNRRIDIVCM